MAKGRNKNADFNQEYPIKKNVYVPKEYDKKGNPSIEQYLAELEANNYGRHPRNDTPYPEQMPGSVQEKNPLIGLYGKPLSFRRGSRTTSQPVVKSGGGGSGSGTRTSAPAGETDVIVDTRTSDPSAVLPTANLDSLQNTYQTYQQKSNLPQFQWDDYYKADDEGYRDFAGYIGDLSKTALGAFGATKPLDVYSPSANFNTMQSEALMRRDLGIDQETRSQFENSADRIYNYDVKNIRNMSGGSGGTALANLGGASDRYYEAQNQLAVLDQQVKGQNRNDFANAALSGESVHRQIFDDKRQIDILNKQSAGNLMADSMDNIKHRKEYEDTYLKPGSPYYEYMKELNLDRRFNRELLDFSQKENVRKLNEELVNVENQTQDDIERNNRGVIKAKEEFNNAIKANGAAPVIESSADFKEYNGQPVVDINKPIGSPEDEEMKLMADLRDKETFGLTRTEMSSMSDEQLGELGIERTTNERGTEQYGITMPMDDPDGIKTDADPELSNQIDNISREYSVKKKALMDEWYLKDEKKYNKLLKEMEDEEKAAKEALKTEYLKVQ